MSELIKISINEKNESIVSARDLHKQLEVKTDFTDWCKRMFEYGFTENVDYSLLKIGEGSAHNKVDYALLLDTSKEIAMVQKTLKGKEVRQYFIEYEKLKQPIVVPEVLMSPMEIAMIHMQKTLEIEKSVINQNVRILAIEATQAKAALELNSIERSTESVPDIGIRLKINQIVRSYVEKNNMKYPDVWSAIYRKMLYTYHFNVNGYKKIHDKESKLDILERNNQLDNLFAIVSKELN